MKQKEQKKRTGINEVEKLKSKREKQWNTELVLRKDQKNWETSIETDKKKIR